MVAKFISKTENNGWCQRKTQFQKALSLALQFMIMNGTLE